MAFAVWQGNIVNEAGDIQPSAWIEVRQERAGMPLVQVFGDPDGTIALGNPFQADAEGFARFYVPGVRGGYRIRAYIGNASSPTFERIWKNVAIGTGAQFDFGTLTVQANVKVPDLAARAAYDDEAAQFSVIVEIDSSNDNLPTYYYKETAAHANWSDGFTVQGPPGPPGSAQVVATSTTSLAISTGSKTWTLDQIDRGYAVGARIVATSDADPINRRMSGVITAYSGTTLQVQVDAIVGAGTFDDWTIALSGERGPAGADGSDPGALYNWDTGTADADPGQGNIRANNSDLSSATELYVSKLNRESDDLSGYLLALAASSNPTVKGGLIIRHTPSGSQAIFQITGVTDATGYVKVAVQGHSGATAFADAAQISFQSSRAGDAGSMSGPASSIDGEIPEFDGTTGTALRGSGATFPLDGTSVDVDASDVGNDSGVIGDDVADALDTLNADVSNREVVGHLAGLTTNGGSANLTSADDGTLVRQTSGSANTITIQDDATGGFSGVMWGSVQQAGAGVTTITAAAGVTLNGVVGGSVEMPAQWAMATLVRVGVDEWTVNLDGVA